MVLRSSPGREQSAAAEPQHAAGCELCTCAHTTLKQSNLYVHHRAAHAAGCGPRGVLRRKSPITPPPHTPGAPAPRRASTLRGLPRCGYLPLTSWSEATWPNRCAANRNLPAKPPKRAAAPRRSALRGRSLSRWAADWLSCGRRCNSTVLEQQWLRTNGPAPVAPRLVPVALTAQCAGFAQVS